jgi:hypothetical protein
MVQAVIRPSVLGGSLDSTQMKPCRISDGKSGMGIGSFQSTSAFRCPHHSTSDQ